LTRLNYKNRIFIDFQSENDADNSIRKWRR